MMIPLSAGAPIDGCSDLAPRAAPPPAPTCRAGLPELSLPPRRNGRIPYPGGSAAGVPDPSARPLHPPFLRGSYCGPDLVPHLKPAQDLLDVCLHRVLALRVLLQPCLRRESDDARETPSIKVIRWSTALAMVAAPSTRAR